MDRQHLDIGHALQHSTLHITFRSNAVNKVFFSIFGFYLLMILIAGKRIAAEEKSKVAGTKKTRTVVLEEVDPDNSSRNERN